MMSSFLYYWCTWELLSHVLFFGSFFCTLWLIHLVTSLEKKINPIANVPVSKNEYLSVVSTSTSRSKDRENNNKHKSHHKHRQERDCDEKHSEKHRNKKVVLETKTKKETIDYYGLERFKEEEAGNPICEQLLEDQERHNVVEIVKPFLLLGDRYATYDLAEGINPWGITRIINVADNFIAPVYPEHFQYKIYHFPMQDEYEQQFVAYLYQTIDIINEARNNVEKQERVLIHCKHGKNRSVSIIAGFLLLEGYVFSLSQAMSLIRRRSEHTRMNSVSPRLQYIKTLLRLEPQCLVDFPSPCTASASATSATASALVNAEPTKKKEKHHSLRSIHPVNRHKKKDRLIQQRSRSRSPKPINDYKLKRTRSRTPPRGSLAIVPDSHDSLNENQGQGLIFDETLGCDSESLQNTKTNT